MPAEIQHEDELCTAFNDINPKNRVHILIVPRKHIPTIADMEEGDEVLMGHLIKTAKELAAKNSCRGYQLKFLWERRRAGGFHVHLHLVGN